MIGLAVAVLLAATAAGSAAGDPSMDALLARCAAERSAYQQALANDSPPEIVDASLRDLLASLQGLPVWSDAEIARRRALDDQAMRPDAATLRANPSVALAGQLSKCLTGVELRRRAGGHPPSP